MKAISTIVTCYLALMAFSNTTAQVVANFSIDSPSGCSPLSVNFTNTSSGTGTLTYSWDLGNGNTSTLQDPKAVYSNAGIYTVKLTVSNGSLSNTAQKTLVVYKNPTANFSASQKACISTTIPFTDLSVKGDANITNWNWDFRNGISSTEQNPSNDYIEAGKHDVFLQVTDGNGCKSSVDKKGYIDIVDKPLVSFYATPATSCNVPTTVQFNNQSNGGGTLTYSWDFGGGSTSAIKNPTHTYTSFGTYNVILKVTSDYGCSSSIDVASVEIGAVNAVGSLKQGNKTIQNNGIVCSGDIDYANLSVGNSMCLWDFGDGSTSNTPNGKHSFPNAGNFKIKLIAAPGDACADTVLWNVTVEKAIAEFSLTPESSCNPSTPVAFSNQSSANIISNNWIFNDGSTSELQNIIKVFTEPTDKDQYVIHEAISYPIKLVVTSTNGCKDSIEKNFDVHQPTALFSASIVKGCAPLTVSFEDLSISSDPIVTKYWNWGESTVQSTPLTSINHTYNTPGVYEVNMVVETSTKCKDNSAILTIKVGSKVVPDFTINNATICSSQKIEFADQSPIGQNRWHYSINGIGVSSCPETANPSVYMKTDIGSFPVSLTVENNGCISEVTKLNAVTNSGPVGNFDFTNNCSSARSVSFKGVSKSATSFKWEFGDSQTNTTDINTTHIYSTEGNYTVKFITYNGSCSDTTIRVVKIRDHQPGFTLKAEACAGNAIYFNSKSSHKLFESCAEKYLWNFGDNSQMIRTKNDSVSHAFTEGGTFPVNLYAFYEDGCTDSISKSIRIYKPTPLFTVNKTEGCSPLPVTFTESSTPDVHPINFWSWDYGDGNSSSYTSKLNTLDYTFINPGEYITILSISDDFGCTATYEKIISTALPTAEFSAITSTEICAGKEVEFLIDYPNPDSAIWNFGNGHKLKSIAKPTKYLYTDTGSFDVALTLYKYGCSSYFSYNKYIEVQKADARFSASDTVYNCYPRSITMNHTAGKKNVQSGKWYYGHGNNSSPDYLNTTVYNYSEPGTFEARLELQTNFGCTDTFKRSIKISGPIGSFNIDPKNACKGDEISYSIKDTSNVYSFEWDLGDGNLTTGNPVKHRFESVGNKIAKLILYGDKGKCIPPAVEDSVHIYDVSASISVADTSVCEGTTIDFVNKSTGATTNNWNFGDGAVSASISPSHLLAPGTFKVTLMTLGLYGCKDTAVQYIIVSKMPTLTVSNDTSICIGGKAFLKSTSDREIRWEPVTDLDSASIPNPIAIPKQSIYYTAFATDIISQCFRKDSVHIMVQPIPVIQLDVEDSTIIAGRPIRIAANTEEGATFEWSPADFLSCNNCFNPISTTRVNTNYILKVTDKNKCFTVEKQFNIVVEEGDKAFDVPSAFTPGKGEENSIFKVEGYNIKQLLEFKIYNRWGNLVFSSNDRARGWDGNYQGKAQPVDSYVYTIKIETFDGIIETKTGTVLLLR